MGLEGSSGGIMPLEATIGSRRTFRLPLHASTDIVGVALLLLLVAVTVAASRGDLSQLLLLLVACAGALAAGRALGTVHRAVVPAAVIAVAAVVAIVDRAGSFGSGPPGGPFGDGSAAGAFFVKDAIAGVLVAVATRRAPWIVLGAACAFAFAMLAGSASVAAAVSLGAVLVALPVIVRQRWARPVVLVAGLLFLAVLATTIALGTSYREGDRAGGLEGALRSVVTEHRVALWHAALEILAENPGGVGPGRFDDVPPRLLPGGEVRWAHDEFLQQGAELGWLGLILTVLLFVWAFARLWVHPAPDAVVALGAASLAVLGIHASVDYVLHFPAVPIAAAALLGTAQAAPSASGLADRGQPP